MDGEGESTAGMHGEPRRVDRVGGDPEAGGAEKQGDGERDRRAAGGYGRGPDRTTVARSGWRWARAASFTWGAVTAR